MKVESNKVLPVNDNQTAIITSKTCNEAFCFAIIDGGVFYKICKSNNVNFIKSQCQKIGFPDDYLIDNTDNNEHCAYLIPAASQNGIALVVEEIEKNGRKELALSRCMVSHWEPIKGYKNKENKIVGQEMY